MSDEISKPATQIVFEIQDRNGEPLVSARELHEKLEVKTRFNDWFDRQMETLGFSQDEDFYSNLSKTQNDMGRPAVDYLLTSDVAKHVALASKTERGKQIRQWFIDLERSIRIVRREPTKLELARDLVAALEDVEAKNLLIAHQVEIIESQKAAVDFVNNYVRADGLFTIRNTAKNLHIQEKIFIKACLKEKVLYRENGRLVPFANWLAKGYFDVKTGEKNGHAFQQTRFTSAGLEWIREKLNLEAVFASSNALIPGKEAAFEQITLQIEEEKKKDWN